MEQKPLEYHERMRLVNILNETFKSIEHYETTIAKLKESIDVITARLDSSARCELYTEIRADGYEISPRLLYRFSPRLMEEELLALWYKPYGARKALIDAYFAKIEKSPPAVETETKSSGSAGVKS